MKMDVKTTREPNGTHTVVVTMTDLPNEQQAEEAVSLIKRTLSAQDIDRRAYAWHAKRRPAFVRVDAP